jgi:hypothetical protein
MEEGTQHREERGAAMIVAVIVSMVIMVFSLTLLLSSYALYVSVQGGVTEIQCRELAASISAEVEQELTETDQETPLYSYLRAMLWQEDEWPAYASEEMKLETVCKYFSLEIPDGYEDLADQVLMTLYWTVEQQEEGAPCAVVHISIRAGKNDDAYVTEQAYGVEITRNTSEEHLVKTTYGTEIDENEQWTFTRRSGT